MERDKINELFDYYFGEAIKESCDEVWDAQEDIIDFCEFVIGKLNISDVRQHLINHIETRINYFSGGESMKSLREISTDRDIVKELESLRKIINDYNF